MDAVKAWAAGLCAVSMGCVLLKMLAPKGGMGKLIHLIIAAFFVCCFAAPLMKLTALEEWELPELSSSTQAQALEQTVTQQLERQIDTALRETARTVLSIYGIEMTKSPRKRILPRTAAYTLPELPFIWTNKIFPRLQQPSK